MIPHHTHPLTLLQGSCRSTASCQSQGFTLSCGLLLEYFPHSFLLLVLMPTSESISHLYPHLWALHKSTCQLSQNMPWVSVSCALIASKSNRAIRNNLSLCVTPLKMNPGTHILRMVDWTLILEATVSPEAPPLLPGEGKR